MYRDGSEDLSSRGGDAEKEISLDSHSFRRSGSSGVDGDGASSAQHRDYRFDQVQV